MNRNDWITQAARLQAAQQAFALVTVLRAEAPTSAKPGDKALVTADGQIHGWIGGGCAQPAVLKTVRRALADGQSQTIRIAPTDTTAERTLGDVLEFGMACHSGGTLELFVDPVLPATQLTVFGDSPVARALVGLAPRVGLCVALVAEGAMSSDHPDASVVLASDEASHVVSQLNSGGYAVVATQGRRDLPGLKAALALAPSHLWFVASERKAGVLRSSLVAGGEDADRVAGIIAPAGESIGAQTPEEIALSVLAAVVAAHRGRATHRQEPAPLAPPAAGQEDAVMPAKSCCGGAQQAADPTPASQTPAVTVANGPQAVKKSCCGS
ncbi:XdhC family protein [Hydrogenophaga sp. PAMC20947]|uniref:XdhC family protein n=1 Tax=Hydrogenophaga sp. PAMC20947 TaxID=2565558 RepID=UPI001447B5A8|nr:XdhC family protein [Hydrogenophaga sp. PAMC20947]